MASPGMLLGQNIRKIAPVYRSSHTCSPTHKNDSRRRSFFSIQASSNFAVQRNAAKKRSFVIMVEESAVRYFLDIYETKSIGILFLLVENLIKIRLDSEPE
jgi:hypothetical protein